MNLRKELSYYNEWSVPDYLYDAWRIMFRESSPSDKQEILRQAEFDLQENEELRRQHFFNQNRRQMTRLENAKFNWSSK